MQTAVIKTGDYHTVHLECVRTTRESVRTENMSCATDTRYFAKTVRNDSISRQANLEQIGLQKVRHTAPRRAAHLDFSQSLGRTRLRGLAKLTQKPVTSVFSGLIEPR